MSLDRDGADPLPAGASAFLRQNGLPFVQAKNDAPRVPLSGRQGGKGGPDIRDKPDELARAVRAPVGEKVLNLATAGSRGGLSAGVQSRAKLDLARARDPRDWVRRARRTPGSSVNRARLWPPLGRDEEVHPPGWARSRRSRGWHRGVEAAEPAAPAHASELECVGRRVPLLRGSVTDQQPETSCGYEDSPAGRSADATSRGGWRRHCHTSFALRSCRIGYG